MEKVAKLVMVSFLSRVIVNKEATDQEIIDKARASVLQRIPLEFYENVEEIADDKECPYGTFDTDELL